MLETLISQIPLDLIFYVIAVPAVVISGISKGGFGGGLGVVSVPLLALLMPVNVAAAIMLPILCFMDIMGVWAFRGKWDWGQLKTLIPAAFIGIIIGTLTFEYTNDAWVRLFIGMIALSFSAKYFLQKFKIKFKNAQEAKPKVANTLTGYFWGTIAGFTSFVAHAGGPPVGAYLLPQKLDKSFYQGTTVFFFTFVNFVKLVPYGMTGQFEGNVMGTSLILLPLALLGIVIGIKLHHKIAPDLFYLLCYSFLILTGLKLVSDWVRYMI